MAEGQMKKAHPNNSPPVVQSLVYSHSIHGQMRAQDHHPRILLVLRCSSPHSAFPTSANPFQPIQPGLPDSASAQPGSPFLAHKLFSLNARRARSCRIVPNRAKSHQIPRGGGPSAHPLSIISRCAFCRQSLACDSRPFCK